MTNNIECPECAAAVETQDPIQGEVIDCADCGIELEIVATNPLQIALAPEEQEDWGE